MNPEKVVTERSGGTTTVVDQPISPPSAAAGPAGQSVAPLTARNIAKLSRRFFMDRREMGLRLAVGVVAVSFPGRFLFEEWLRAFRAGSPYRALIAPVAASLVVGGWRQLCRREELPIHDRHVDGVTSLGLLAIAASLVALLSPRLLDLEGAARLDLLVAPVWLFALCCAIFGTRPAWRHRHSFVVFGLLWPVPYDLVAPLLNRSNFGWWILSTTVVVTVVLLGDCGTVVRTLSAAAGAVAALIVAHQSAPVAGPLCLMVGGGVALCCARLFGARVLVPRESVTALLKRPYKPVVGHTPIVMVLTVALALGWTWVVGNRAPDSAIPRAPVGALLGHDNNVTECPLLSGWTSGESVQPAAQRSVGEFAELRCEYRSAGVRPTRAVVDISEPVALQSLVQFPWETDHQVIGTEQAATTKVRVAPGVEAWSLAYNAPARPLTTVVVTWMWSLPGRDESLGRRVSVIVNDDPLANSPFPVAGVHVGSALVKRLQQVLRTNLTRALRYQPLAKNQAVAEQLAHEVAGAGT